MQNIIYARLETEDRHLTGNIASMLNESAKVHGVSLIEDVAEAPEEVITNLNSNTEAAAPDVIVVTSPGLVEPNLLNRSVPVFDISEVAAAPSDGYWIGKGRMPGAEDRPSENGHGTASFIVDERGNFHGLDSAWQSMGEASSWLRDFLASSKQPVGQVPGQSDVGPNSRPPTGSPGDVYASESEANKFAWGAICGTVMWSMTMGVALTPLGAAAAIGLGTYCSMVMPDAYDDFAQTVSPSDEPSQSKTSTSSDASIYRPDAGVSGTRRTDAGVAPSAGVPSSSSTSGSSGSSGSGGGSGGDQGGKDDKKEPKPKPKPKPKQQTGTYVDDVCGMSFLVLIREWAEKEATDRLWRQVRDGTLPPEETDIWQEYVHWVTTTFDKHPDSEGGILTEDDETGYTFLYHLYRRMREMFVDGRMDGMDWWWRKGAPIDPEEPISIEANVELVMRNLVTEPYVVADLSEDAEVNLEFFVR